MKKKILFAILIVIGIYYLVGHFPKGTYRFKDQDVQIKISITDNLMAVRDPVCTKNITIIDGSEKYQIEFWSEIYAVKIFKRKNGKDVFWVIDEYYRGITRTENGEFPEFTCIDCSGVEKMEGTNILGYEFKDENWSKIGI